MATHTDFQRVSDPADPNRCQRMLAKGQCMNRAVEGSQYCAAHGGTVTRDSRRKYAVTKFRARLDHFAEDPDQKSLHEEIGVLRLMLDAQLTAISDEHELIMRSAALAELVSRIQNCIVAADKLDQRRGQLIDRSVILKMVAHIIDIISQEVTDPDVVENIGRRIMESLGDEG